MHGIIACNLLAIQITLPLVFLQFSLSTKLHVIISNIFIYDASMLFNLSGYECNILDLSRFSALDL